MARNDRSARHVSDANLLALQCPVLPERTIRRRPSPRTAGRLLDDALAEAGIERTDAFVTNAVKHFKWVPRGGMRLHKSPNRTEVVSCRPWLEAEIEAVRPRLLVALGATAGKALLGWDYRVTRQRGEILESLFGPAVLGTIHPSAVLRLRGKPEFGEAYAGFLKDLQQAALELDNP